MAWASSWTGPRAGLGRRGEAASESLGTGLWQAHLWGLEETRGKCPLLCTTGNVFRLPHTIAHIHHPTECFWWLFFPAASPQPPTRLSLTGPQMPRCDRWVQ